MQVLTARLIEFQVVRAINQYTEPVAAFAQINAGVTRNCATLQLVQ